MTAPIESPPVITVSSHEAHKTLPQLRRLALSGAAVRVVDARSPGTPPVWITTTPPDWFGTLISDDTEIVRRELTREIAERQQRTVAEHGLGWQWQRPAGRETADAT